MKTGLVKKLCCRTVEEGNRGRKKISLPDEKGSSRLKFSSMNKCQIFILFVLCAIFELLRCKFQFTDTKKEDDAWICRGTDFLVLTDTQQPVLFCPLGPSPTKIVWALLVQTHGIWAFYR